MERPTRSVFVSVDAHELLEQPWETVASIRSARESVHARAWGSPRRGLDLMTLGSTDLVVVDALPDLSYVAAGSSPAPGLLQRSTAGLLPSAAEASWDGLMEPEASRPFHAVARLRLEPALVFALGDLLPDLLVTGLSGLVDDRLEDAARIDPDWCASRVDLGVVWGLDTAELLLLAKAPDLAVLARLVHVLRALRAGETPGLDLGLAARRVRSLPFSVPEPERALRDTPLFGSVGVDIGMAVDLVAAARERGDWVEGIACRQGRVMRLPKAHDGGGLVVADADPAETDWRGWSSGEIATLLDASRRRSHLVVRPWSRGHAADPALDRGLATALDATLVEARLKWLPSPDRTATAYSALKDAAARGHWAYGRTNAALSLTAELSGLLSDRLRIQGHLDLAEPLSTWIREVIAAPTAGPDTRRAYRHLDRMMQARSGRASDRTTTGYEARAGYVLLRDGFQAYLAELLVERGCGHITPVLVDGADTSLRLKFGGALAYFEVSAQRLLNPVLWPAIAHEVEHLRLSRQKEGVWGPALGAYLKRLPGVVHGLDPRVDDGPEGLFERLRRAHAAISLEPGWQGWVGLGGTLLEIAADLALFDSTVLGTGKGPERWTRLLGTLWPNLAMDLRERQGGRRWTDDELLALCRRLLFRFASTWVLAFFPVGLPVFLQALDDDEGRRATTRADVLDLLRTALVAGAVRPELLALVVEVTRPAGGSLDALVSRASKALSESVLPLVRLASAGQPIEPSERQLASIHARTLAHADARRTNGVEAHGWPEMLALVHALRHRTRKGGQAGRAVAAFVHRVEAECDDATRIVPGAPHLPLAPRGGFTAGDAAAQAQANQLPELVAGLRDPIRRQRGRALGAFLGCAVHGRVLLLVLRPEAPRHWRYLQHALREGGLQCGASLGEVVADGSLADELHGAVGSGGRDGPLALLVDLETDRVASCVLHPGLGDPETYGQAARVVQYLVDRLAHPESQARPGSWCHRAQVHEGALARRLRALGLLGATRDHPAQPDGLVLDPTRPTA
ncbi:MAG: hypothetical protein GY913_16405 [Proteobacteria bacterium]|nr:hypothetical protein [Pseudomonadota bacterium]MCP4918487.1 hypothetical protein [Pseudomonadota bacterium]